MIYFTWRTIECVVSKDDIAIILILITAGIDNKLLCNSCYLDCTIFHAEIGNTPFVVSNGTYRFAIECNLTLIKSYISKWLVCINSKQIISESFGCFKYNVFTQEMSSFGILSESDIISCNCHCTDVLWIISDEKQISGICGAVIVDCNSSFDKIDAWSSDCLISINVCCILEFSIIYFNSIYRKCGSAII